MIDASKLKGMDGVQYLASVPDGETIVSMAEFEGNLYIATNREVYKLVNDKKLEPLNLKDVSE